MNVIQDFAFIGVKNLYVMGKKTRETVAELPYLLGFNLSDNQPIEYLRGGFERLKLLPFKGDRETSVTVTTATACPELLKLQLNTEFEEVEQNFKTEENVVGTDGSFTLKETPAVGEPVDVWAVDAQGKKTKLTVAETVAEGSYVINDNTITTEATVEKIRVLYYITKTAQVLKAKDVDTKTYEVSATVVAQEVGTGDMYLVQVDIPSAVFQLNNQLDASNEGGVPDNVEFTIDMLADATKDYVYMISFRERI